MIEASDMKGLSAMKIESNELIMTLLSRLVNSFQLALHNDVQFKFIRSKILNTQSSKYLLVQSQQ